MEHIGIAKKAAREAGKIQLNFFNKNLKHSKKKDSSFVTNVDIASEQLIKRLIRKHFPNHNIIAEESEQEDKKSEYTWYIDPLDGTHNYIHKIPLFGVSIGLMRKQEIILGVIYLPYYNKMYSAEKGKGAFCNGKRIRVSKRTKEEGHMILVELPNNTLDTTLKLIKVLKKPTTKIRAFACSVFQLTLVAEGKADSFIHTNAYSWDVVAGKVIVEEAGATVTDLYGKPWDVSHKDILVTNGQLHSWILECVKKVGL